MRVRWWFGSALVGTALCFGSAAGAVCVGDCGGDGRVSIADVQACVNLASDLGSPACANADQNNDGNVDANEVDRCILSFLDASTCPMVFTPQATSTAAAPTNTPVPTNTQPAPATGTATQTRTVPSTATAVSTSTRTPASTPTNTPIPVTPTAVATCPLQPGSYTTTQVAGGTLQVYSFEPFSFPVGGQIKQDVGPATMPDCVHNTVVPAQGGFVAPNFCVQALSFTTSVTQDGCGIGRIDSNGGSDFKTNEIADTSDSSSTCNLRHMPCANGANSGVRVDVTVGDGVPDTCTGGGTANALVNIPVHTVSWVDNSGGTFMGCQGNGVFEAGDMVAAEFDQILDFTTDTATGKWMDIDGDGCTIAGFGPAFGFTRTGKCIDLAGHTITAAAVGQFGATGGLFDGSFATVLPSTFDGPTAATGATCASPPVINYSGQATRCIP